MTEHFPYNAFPSTFDRDAEVYDVPTMSFEDYRHLCDNATINFRQIGLLDEQSYAGAVADESTRFVTLDGLQVPALVDISYEDGYDTERCKELTNKEDVFLLTLPLGMLYREDVQESLGKIAPLHDSAIIVESPPSFDASQDESRNDIRNALQGVGGVLEGRDFINEWLKDNEEHKRAWMGIFGITFEPTPEAHEQPAAVTLEEAWNQRCSELGQTTLPGADAEGAFMFTAAQLQSEEFKPLVDELWKISEQGFGKVLGAFHPVSMEESTDVFKSQLFSEGSYTAVRYHEGKPLCFGSLSFDLKSCPWLNHESAIITNEQLQAREQGQEMVFFSEVISNGEKGAGFSLDVLELFLDLAGRTHRDYRILFESTNLSATYIPKIAAQEIDKAKRVQMISKPQLLDKLDYWYLDVE